MSKKIKTPADLAAQKVRTAAVRAAYYQRHKSVIRARTADYQAGYRAAHQEQIKQLQADWYINHRGEVLARRAVYRAANREQLAGYQAERRARQRDAQPSEPVGRG